MVLYPGGGNAPVSRRRRSASSGLAERDSKRRDVLAKVSRWTKSRLGLIMELWDREAGVGMKGREGKEAEYARVLVCISPA